MRPNATVFYTGANSCGAGHTAIYNSREDEGSWRAGPDFPDGLDIADGPAALLPNGNVLVDASPGFGNLPTFFFEFDGTSLNPVPGPPNAAIDSSFYGNMLVLPTGQILFTDFSDEIEIYTGTGTYNPILGAKNPKRTGQCYCGAFKSFPGTVSTDSRKAQLTATMPKRPRTICWCESRTAQLGTSSRAVHMTTAAWPWPRGTSCLRILTYRRTRKQALVTS